MNSTRRMWLFNSLAAGAWAEIAAARQYAQATTRSANAVSFQSFDSAMAAEIDAIAAQIIPSTDGPGAREAGVIFFIDRALSTFDAENREAYLTGMSSIQKKREQLFPESTSIAGLTSGQQLEFMRAIQDSEFFELLRTHTLLGFLGGPSYGGNRDQVGWKHIGFEDRMFFEPPFGYYDAQRTGEQT